MSRDAIRWATNLLLGTPFFGIGRVSGNGSVLNRWKLEKGSVASVYFFACYWKSVGRAGFRGLYLLSGSVS
jgi:hypothetical protein